MTVPESDNPALTNALSECVDSILHGGSVEECLQRFPDLVDELRPLLLTATGIQVRPERDDSLRSANRLRFEGAARYHLAGREAREPGGRVSRWWNYRTPSLSRAWTAGIAGLALTFILSTGAAVASTDSLPDSPLYPVKRVTEHARLAMTFSEDSRALYHLELIERRTRELASMAEDGQTDHVDQLSREILRNIEFARVEAGFSTSDAVQKASIETASASDVVSDGAGEDSPAGQTTSEDGEPTLIFSSAPRRQKMDEKTRAYLDAEGITAAHTHALLLIAHQQAPEHLKAKVAEALTRAEARYEQAHSDAVSHPISSTLFAQGIVRINGGVLTLGGGLRFILSHDALGNRPPRDGDLATIGGYMRDDGVLLVLRLYAVDGEGISDKEIRLQAGSLSSSPNELRIPGFRIVPALGAEYAVDADDSGRWVYVQGTVTESGNVRGEDIRILNGAPIRFPDW